METQKINKGDLFQTSWGYDQTNYDFIIVEEISPSGKTAICKRTMYVRNEEESSMGQDALQPIKKSFGLPFRMRIEYPTREHFNGQVWLRGSYPLLSRYDEDSTEENKKQWLNSKRLDTFSKVEEGRTYSQTNPMFGH
jgi:hypothetical protein